MVNRQPGNRPNCFVKITMAPTYFLFPAVGWTERGAASRPAFGLKPTSLAGEGNDWAASVWVRLDLEVRACGTDARAGRARAPRRPDRSAPEAANKDGEKTKAEGTQVKEVAPAK